MKSTTGDYRVGVFRASRILMIGNTEKSADRVVRMRRLGLIGSVTLSLVSLITACANSPAAEDLSSQDLTTTPAPDEDTESVQLPPSQAPKTTTDAGPDTGTKDSGSGSSSSSSSSGSSTSSSGSSGTSTSSSSSSGSSGTSTAACDMSSTLYLAEAVIEIGKSTPHFCSPGCNASQCCFTIYNVCVAQ